MNENTLVTVHCYEGDKQQVLNFMPCYLHHECPVIIMSPEDSKVEVPGIICRHAGRRAYIGQESLDRQRMHLQMALEYPYEYFLLNDSDSFCVSPEIPKFLYEQSDGVVWSGEVTDPREHPSPYPKIAMQPPYFLNRASLVRMLAVAHRVFAHPITPYIDHYMLQLTCEAGLQHKSHLVGATESDRLLWHPVKTMEVFNQRRDDYQKTL